MTGGTTTHEKSWLRTWVRGVLFSPEFICAGIGGWALSAPFLAIFLIGEGDWPLIVFIALYGGVVAIAGLPFGLGIRLILIIFKRARGKR
jgi:hypothetical protein